MSASGAGPDGGDPDPPGGRGPGEDDPRPVAPYDHLRAGADAPVPAGVYRVVGTGAPVALLRVVEDGRRVRSGAVVRVERAGLGALAPAGNPDTGWSRLRQLPAAVRSSPLRGGLGLAALAAGGWSALTGDAVAGAVLALAGLATLSLLVR